MRVKCKKECFSYGFINPGEHAHHFKEDEIYQVLSLVHDETKTPYYDVWNEAIKSTFSEQEFNNYFEVIVE